jgi:hypothetical protein
MSYRISPKRNSQLKVSFAPVEVNLPVVPNVKPVIVYQPQSTSISSKPIEKTQHIIYDTLPNTQQITHNYNSLNDGAENQSIAVTMQPLPQSTSISSKPIEKTQHIIYDTLPNTQQIKHNYNSLNDGAESQFIAVTMQPVPRVPDFIKSDKKIRATTYSKRDVSQKINEAEHARRKYTSSENAVPNVIRVRRTMNFANAVVRTSDGQLVWDHQESHARYLYNIRYTVVPARQIYNLASPELVKKAAYWDESVDKKAIAQRYIERFDQEVGFYSKLEKSIVEEGIRNPILVTTGFPRWRQIDEISPEYRQSLPQKQWVLCEFLGGSRLYIAQKNNWLVPVIVSDWTNQFTHAQQIFTVDELKDCFVDPPEWVYFTKRGVRTTPPPHVHLSPEHQSPQLLSEIRRNIISEDLTDD